MVNNVTKCIAVTDKNCQYHMLMSRVV